jgi:Fe2+ transport system protein FeoA
LRLRRSGCEQPEPPQWNVFKKLKLILISPLEPSFVPIIPLELLAAGERARIAEIDGDDAFVNRLNEMGLSEDVEIKMVQSGSPCIIALDNHRLSFRGEEAGMIFVDTD